MDRRVSVVLYLHGLRARVQEEFRIRRDRRTGPRSSACTRAVVHAWPDHAEWRVGRGAALSCVPAKIAIAKAAIGGACGDYSAACIDRWMDIARAGAAGIGRWYGPELRPGLGTGNGSRDRSCRCDWKHGIRRRSAGRSVEI